MTQGKMSIAEYEATFIALSKYTAALVTDEVEKCRMFQDGLNHQMKARIILLHIRSYPELVQAALEAEEIEKDFASRRQEKEKRSAFSYIPSASWFRRDRRPQKSG